MVQDDGGTKADNRGETLTMRRALNVATMGSFANMAIGVVSALVVSRVYGAAILGAYALAYVGVAMLPLATSLCEQPALVRLLAMEPQRGERGSGLALAALTLSYTLTLLIGPLVALGSAFYLIHAARLPEAVAPMVALVIGYIVLDKLSWNIDGVLSAYRAAGPLAIANLLNSGVMATAAIVLALAHRSLWSLTIASLISSAAALGFRLWAVRPYLRWKVPRDAYRGGLREIPGMIRFGLRMLPGSISEGLTFQSALWVLGATAPVASVGAFSRAQSITVKIGDLNHRLAAVIYPSLVRRAHINDGGRSFVADVMTLLSRTFAPLFIVLCGAAGASHTILALFGQDFLSAEGALSVLLIATGISIATMIFGEGLTALNRPSLVSIGYVVGLIATLGPLIPLTRSYGATGAAVAFLIGTATSTVFLFTALVVASPGKFGPHHLAIRGLALAASSVVAYALVHWVQTVAGAPLTAAVGFALTGLVLWARRRAISERHDVEDDQTVLGSRSRNELA
ncbi:MAG: oligosaccharide flippase family protein [Mycobacterium sp.]